ncbi:ABC transporter permease [Corynebacterium uterequi]|uniref:ABC-type dipeptide/oligopeptide/nickel transport system, permease component n=1 Tax=Corynebacterium uterequi TaxID=1072256 RepID=A0A0G3HFQ8_9CORY|nr:ABC transporter permease [Corynebacterium uterequi]AKK11605.1 ABC-type dipeptide/oligopeptide/nickel transport system, permease component [Corynebacterium uterequi]
MRILLRYATSLLVASLLIFAVMRLIPGDPARIALGVTATDDAVAALSHQLGTDRPLPTQYFTWITGLLTGDFGVSLASGENITALVVDRAQVSLILCGAAMVASLALAVPLGVAAARGSWLVSAATQVGIAIPSFLAAILLIGLFSVRLGWFPANGWVPPGDDPAGFASRIVLPVVALTAVQASILTRYVRNAVLDVSHADHLRTARALGASRTSAMARHGVRSVALPVLTVAGVQLTSLIVGAVVIERVFLLPGLGSMLLDAVAARDIPVVQTIVMLLVVFTLSVNLLVDVAYRVIDPRLRRQRDRRPA